MTDTYTTIPLNKLARAKGNVRRTGGSDRLEELMASIESHGLLQGLTVRPRNSGNGKASDKYEVVAGGRRLAALKQLARSKRIPRTFGVPCRVLNGEDPLEVSLAENVVRIPLHPVDQLEAFKTLHDQGLPAEDIAARFGVSTTVVLQRLKLAAVSPRLIEVYREGGITLEQLTAFAISDDHAAQERVWFESPSYRLDPRSIRQALTDELVPASDRRARFVGREAYEAAGGRLVRDLFSSEDEAYLEDAGLLERMVAEKLQAEADAIKAEGWSWVQAMPDLDYGIYGRMGRLQPAEAPLSEEKEAELRALFDRFDTLMAEHGEDAPPEIEAEYERLSQAVQTIEALRSQWQPEVMASAGALITIDHDGRPEVIRGLVRPEDRIEEANGEMEEPSAELAETDKKPQAKPAHSEALVEELTAHRTAAFRALLSGNSDVALTAITHAMLLGVFYGEERMSCLEVKPVVTDVTAFASDIAASRATVALKQRWEQWISRIPPVDGLWGWLLGQDRETRLELLALATAATVNVVQRRHQCRDEAVFVHADALASTVGLDMADWWEPTRESYFDHVAKAQVLAAVTEGVSAQAAENIARMKKPAMAARAEDLLAGKRWLPEPLRFQPPSTAGEA